MQTNRVLAVATRGPFIYTHGGAWLRASHVVQVTQREDEYEGRTALHAANGAVWTSDEPIEVVLRLLETTAHHFPH